MSASCGVEQGCDRVVSGSCRGCGRPVCDSHLDLLTDLCLICVPVDEEDYQVEISRFMLVQAERDALQWRLED